ncbi:MAG: hypothetical protein PVH68_10545 [Armatimonadota bacterium]
MRSRECIALLVTTVLVVVSALAALQLKRERDAIRTTLTQYAAAVPIAMVGAPGAREPQRLAALVREARDNIRQGQYSVADERLAQIPRERPARAEEARDGPPPAPEARRPRPERAPGEGALRRPLRPGGGRSFRGLDPKAREFFDAHPELRDRARALAGRIMAGGREGADVEEAQELLREAMSAAERGDAETVGRFIERTQRALGVPRRRRAPQRERAAPDRERQGSRTERPSPEVDTLRRRVAQFQEAARRAQAEGRDVRDANALMPKLRDAVAARDAKRAAELLEEATARLQRAKPAQRRPGQRETRRPPGGRPRGAGDRERPLPSQTTAARRLVQTLMATMAREQDSLNKAWTSILNAELALREKNQDQVREILRDAAGELVRIERGRRALVRLSREGPGRPSEREGGAGVERAMARLGGPLPVPFVEPREAIAQIGEAFDKVHTLSDEEYAERKPRLAIALLERVVVTPEEPEEEAGTPVTEEAVRRKLEAAEEPYRDARASDGSKADKAERLLAEARRLLYEREYEEANEAADRALELLGVPVVEAAAEGVAERPRREEREATTGP